VSTTPSRYCFHHELGHDLHLEERDAIADGEIGEQMRWVRAMNCAPLRPITA
jgi:hypothetical protein